MKQFSLFIHLMLSVLLFSSCGGRSKTASVIEAEKAIPLRYAENLNLSASEDYTIARLRNPWDTTRILHTYGVRTSVPSGKSAGRDFSLSTKT
jgi:iron complex transport system substrate-binding protein